MSRLFQQIIYTKTNKYLNNHLQHKEQYSKYRDIKANHVLHKKRHSVNTATTMIQEDPSDLLLLYDLIILHTTWIIYYWYTDKLQTNTTLINVDKLFRKQGNTRMEIKQNVTITSIVASVCRNDGMLLILWSTSVCQSNELVVQWMNFCPVN